MVTDRPVWQNPLCTIAQTVVLKSTVIIRWTGCNVFPPWAVPGSPSTAPILGSILIPFDCGCGEVGCQILHWSPVDQPKVLLQFIGHLGLPCAHTICRGEGWCWHGPLTCGVGWHAGAVGHWGCTWMGAMAVAIWVPLQWSQCGQVTAKSSWLGFLTLTSC